LLVLLEIKKRPGGDPGLFTCQSWQGTIILSQVPVKVKQERGKMSETKLAIFNFTPAYCPYCGEQLRWPNENPEGRREYRANVSMYCPGCNLRFQLASASGILTAASDSGGDLKQYAEG
jgi:hypothetical protein